MSQKYFYISPRLSVLLILLLCYSCKFSAQPIKTNEKPFVFYVLGDWGAKGAFNQLPVAAQMINESKSIPPDMIITVGDNFYESGVVSITDSHWKLSYENVYKELTQKYPWYASLGNHDYKGNVDAQIAYHSVNANWNMPGRYYTFVKAAPGGQMIRFVVIDTDPYIAPYYTDNNFKDKLNKQDSAAQTHWIDSVLSVAKEPWKIVYGHHPVYCVHPRKGETEILKSILPRMFSKYHVQAYICGHEHFLQHNQPKESKTAYIISGSGAKLTQSPGKEDFSLYVGSEPAFTICFVKDDKMTFQFIDTTGKTIYQSTVSRDIK